jgi:hypothetical protein
MQNHRTRKARKTENLGSSRSARIFTWPRHASSPVSKCIHHDNGQRTHHGHSRVLYPQLSNATVIIHRPVTDGSQRHDGRLQNPHPEVPFASVGYDTVKAFTDLAAIFKLKIQQAPSLSTQASPATVIQRPSLIPLPTPISHSPMPDWRQTRSQTTIHNPDIPNRPLPPRVVTSTRVPTGSLDLSPRNLSQDDFCGMDTSHMAIALENNHCSQRHHANAVIHPITGKEMEYSALMKDPCLKPLWT